MTLVRRTAWWLVPVAIAATQVLAADLEYRVAGLMNLGPDRKLAVVESSDGAQALYRVGDALGDGRIVDIGTDTLVVLLDGERVTLTLSGNPVVLTSDGSAPGELLPPVPPPKTATRVIRPGQAADALRSERRGESAGDRAERINGVLGLPAGTRILAVDRVPVAAVADAVDRMLPLLAANEPVRLTVAGTDEMDEVYLLPEEE